MNQLKIIKHGATETVDSREVAEMIGKRHDHLIRDIGGYIEIMESNESKSGSVTAPNFGVSDFFIPSEYKDSTGRTLPCYLLTKKGCDMVANKLTGQKGVLFTAAYVTAFEAMREHLETGKPLPMKGKQRLGETNAAARIIRQTLKEAGMAPQFVAVAMKSLYAPVGVEIPLEGITLNKRLFDATAIAKHFGMLSKSGSPHAHAVGAILSQIDILDGEKELAPFQSSASGHAGTNWQYTESVVQKVWFWLERHGYPTEIESGGKSYKVCYKRVNV